MNNVTKFLAKTCSITGILEPEIFTAISIMLNERAENIINKEPNFILLFDSLIIAFNIILK